MRLRHAAIVLIAIVAPLALTANAFALTSGSPDPDFQQIGSRQSDPGGDSEIVTDVIVQSDQRIVINITRSDGGIRIHRLLSDGSTDTSFSGGDQFFFAAAPTVIIRKLAIDPMGRIVFGGTSSGTIVVGRLTAAGDLDTSFAPAAVEPGIQSVTTPFSAARLTGLIAEPSGAISYSGIGDTTDSDVFIGRLTTTGANDLSFYPAGTGRKYIGSTDDETSEGMTRLADGRYVLAGFFDDSTDDDGLVTVVLANGSDEELTRIDELDDDERFYAVTAIGPSTVMTSHYDGDGDGRLIQLSINGANVATRDTSFAGDGRSDYFGPNDFRGHSIVRQHDGSWIAAGWTGEFAAPTVGLQRMTTTGTRDTTFGTNGFASFWDSPMSGDNRVASAIMADGGVVVAAKRDGTPGDVSALGRFIGPIARVAASGAASAANVTTGSDVTFTATTTSSGPDTSQAGTMSIVVPASLQVVSAPAGCSAAGSTYTCAYASIGTGGTASVSFVARPTSVGSHSVVVTTDAQTYDDARGDDSASVTVTATAPVPPVVKVKVALTFGQLVKGKLASCGATATKACVATKVVPKRKLAAFTLRAIAKPLPTNSPRRVVLQVQRQVGKKWVAATPLRATILANRTATIALPASLRKQAGMLRVRATVAAGTTTLAATGAWRYVRVK